MADRHATVIHTCLFRALAAYFEPDLMDVHRMDGSCVYRGVDCRGCVTLKTAWYVRKCKWFTYKRVGLFAQSSMLTAKEQSSMHTLITKWFAICLMGNTALSLHLDAQF